MTPPMTRMVCPSCGHVDPDPDARFCDVDGTRLEPQADPNPPPPPPPPLAATARRDDEATTAFPWGLPLAVVGILLLLTSAGITATAGSALDLRPQQVSLDLSVAPPAPSDLIETGGKLFDQVLDHVLGTGKPDNRPTESP